MSVGRTVKVTLPPDILERALAFAPPYGAGGPHAGKPTLGSLVNALVPVLEQLARDAGKTPADLVPWLAGRRL